MTEGEKMVWAAMYARYFMEDCKKEEEYGKYWPRSVPSAIEWASHAVEEMREARQAVVEGWGNDEVLAMLDEMIGSSDP